MKEQKPHLQVEISEAGFKSLPSIPGGSGWQVEVWESSTATRPHIWLIATGSIGHVMGEQVEAAIHLTVENATALAEQLLFLVAEHYRGSGG